MNTLKSFGLLGLSALICLGAALCPAQTLAPEEILRKSDEARGHKAGIQWEIGIHSVESGRTQEETVRVSARDFNSLAEFVAPANMKGQKMLMLDRNMWFIKPGLSKAVPISPRQKLLGAAANGDIASTNYAGDYRITDSGEETVENEPCWRLDLLAVDTQATYDRIRYWISRERLVGVKAEFYTVSGKMFKTALFEYGNHILLNGTPRPFISKMVIQSAVSPADVTTMTYGKVLLKEIPDAAFNLNLLLH